MILPDHFIKDAVDRGTLGIVPFYSEKQLEHGLSYGLSCAGYDVRLSLHGVVGTEIGPLHTGENEKFYRLGKGEFLLASAIEYFKFPAGLVGMLKDKSTNARLGLSVFNTVFEPGWKGFPTLEIVNLGNEPVTLAHGRPIGQMVFYQMAEPTRNPYHGKYQYQADRPVEAIMEYPQ